MSVQLESAFVASEVVVGAVEVPAAAVEVVVLAVDVVVASELVLIVSATVATVEVFVTPAMVNAVTVLAATEQVPPRVTVTVLAAAVPLWVEAAVAVQVPKPVVRPIVGVAGKVKPAGKVTLIVEPLIRAPVEEVV